MKKKLYLFVFVRSMTHCSCGNRAITEDGVNASEKLRHFSPCSELLAAVSVCNTASPFDPIASSSSSASLPLFSSFGCTTEGPGSGDFRAASLKKKNFYIYAQITSFLIVPSL